MLVLYDVQNVSPKENNISTADSSDFNLFFKSQYSYILE